MDNINKDKSSTENSTENSSSINPTTVIPQQNFVNEQSLKKSFKEYVLQKENGYESVYKFTKFLGIEEAEFYRYFSSLNVLEQEIWNDYFEETMSRLKSEEVYMSYTVREKLLAFFYTLFELLKEDRSFIIKTAKDGVLPKWSPGFVEKFKKQYFSYINEMVEEGKESGEVAERFLLTKQYNQGLWLQFLFILNFWIKDESKNFEKTDAAVEKAVNFSLDIMGRSALDSFADFAKFVYQSWKPA